MTTTYRVELDRFSGPLDLLLFLVRRNELELFDLPISRITSQFQLYLSALQFLDLDFAGDFVVMASTLIEIKSRLVLPSPEEEEEVLQEERGRRTDQLRGNRRPQGLKWQGGNEEGEFQTYQMPSKHISHTDTFHFQPTWRFSLLKLYLPMCSALLSCGFLKFHYFFTLFTDHHFIAHA